MINLAFVADPKDGQFRVAKLGVPRDLMRYPRAFFNLFSSLWPDIPSIFGHLPSIYDVFNGVAGSKQPNAASQGAAAPIAAKLDGAPTVPILPNLQTATPTGGLGHWMKLLPGMPYHGGVDQKVVGTVPTPTAEPGAMTHYAGKAYAMGTGVGKGVVMAPVNVIQYLHRNVNPFGPAYPTNAF